MSDTLAPQQPATNLAFDALRGDISATLKCLVMTRQTRLELERELWARVDLAEAALAAPAAQQPSPFHPDSMEGAPSEETLLARANDPERSKLVEAARRERLYRKALDKGEPPAMPSGGAAQQPAEPLIAKLDALIDWDRRVRLGDTSGWAPSISIDEYKAIRAALAHPPAADNRLRELTEAYRERVKTGPVTAGAELCWAIERLATEQGDRNG